MKITFLGAAKTVTGSNFLVEAAGKKFLVDCGMYQGKVTLEETDSLENIKEGVFTLHQIEDVLDYPVIKVDSLLEKKIRNGMKLDNNWNISDKVIFKTEDNLLLGIYERKDTYLQVYKNFC